MHEGQESTIDNTGAWSNREEEEDCGRARRRQRDQISVLRQLLFADDEKRQLFFAVTRKGHYIAAMHLVDVAAVLRSGALPYNVHYRTEKPPRPKKLHIQKMELRTLFSNDDEQEPTLASYGDLLIVVTPPLRAIVAGASTAEAILVRWDVRIDFQYILRELYANFGILNAVKKLRDTSSVEEAFTINDFDRNIGWQYFPLPSPNRVLKYERFLFAKSNGIVTQDTREICVSGYPWRPSVGHHRSSQHPLIDNQWFQKDTTKVTVLPDVKHRAPSCELLTLEVLLTAAIQCHMERTTSLEESLATILSSAYSTEHQDRLLQPLKLESLQYLQRMQAVEKLINAFATSELRCQRLMQPFERRSCGSRKKAIPSLFTVDVKSVLHAASSPDLQQLLSVVIGNIEALIDRLVTVLNEVEQLDLEQHELLARKRHGLIITDLFSSACMLSIAPVLCIAGLFGVNLWSGLEGNHAAFIWITVLSAMFMAIVLGISMRFIRRHTIV